MSYTPIDIQAAEALARQQVQRLWPDLTQVVTSVVRQQRGNGTTPAPAPLRGAGVALESSDVEAYVFTFLGEVHAPDGHTLPRIARVTVHPQRGVVKATISK
ncbi:MAG: hypothetical protein MUD01_00690 [Chloroflexaceae bacterium]|nr:hypothetical protein [Chloroflexaceae bacterium]